MNWKCFKVQSLESVQSSQFKKVFKVCHQGLRKCSWSKSQWPSYDVVIEYFTLKILCFGPTGDKKNGFNNCIPMSSRQKFLNPDYFPINPCEMVRKVKIISENKLKISAIPALLQNHNEYGRLALIWDINLLHIIHADCLVPCIGNHHFYADQTFVHWTGKRKVITLIFCFKFAPSILICFQCQLVPTKELSPPI